MLSKLEHSVLDIDLEIAITPQVLLHDLRELMRGGAYYRPHGSIWYFPQTYRLDEHRKYLLMAPGRDRSARSVFAAS